MSACDRELRGTRILLVDDTPANLEVLGALLESEGILVSIAPSGPIALRVAAESRPDLILLDVMMPGMDGFEVCRRLQANPDTADVPVLFVTARDETSAVVAGFEMGGVDYVTKPFRDEEVLARVRTHLRVSQLSRQLTERNADLQASNEALARKNEQLEQETTRRQALKGQLSTLSEQEAERWGLEGFIGRSPTIRRIFDDIRLVQEAATTSVLITGENGTGKELIARAIHFGSTRREGSFVALNCAAMPGELAESLLFGHVRGSFTGATQDRVGHFEMAHEGTLFLDEVGDMPLDLQAKLLRVLEDGQVQRVGAGSGRKVDVRIVAATNADLAARIRDGRFRQDLFFRLARFTVPVPPLRERREDIALLAEHFLSLYAREMGCDGSPLSVSVVAALENYSFPGNVRELKNIVERALMTSRGEPIRPSHLHFQTGLAAEGANGEPSTPTAVEDVPMDLKEAELWLIQRAIARTDGNISEAARLLGTNRTRVYRAMAQQEHRA
jgi:DNA-binding NtrC family response regulator